MKLLRQHIKRQNLTQRIHQKPPQCSFHQKKDNTYRPMFTEQSDHLRRVLSIQTTQNHSTISSLSRQANIITSKAMNQAETYLQINFKPQINGYLINKFRKFVQSRNAGHNKRRSLPHTQNNQYTNQNNTISSECQTYLTCSRCQKSMKKQEGNQSVFIQNAKQRVLRLMEMRKQKKSELQLVAQNIKKRRIRTQKKKRCKNLEVRMPSLQEQEWDREWQMNQSKQLKRYRNRVTTKSKERKKKSLFLQPNPQL